MPRVSGIVGKALSSEVVTSWRGQGVLLFALSSGHTIHFTLPFNFWEQNDWSFFELSVV